MKALKITLLGATGDMGNYVINEALKRGHSVTAVINDETGIDTKRNNLVVINDTTINKEEICYYAKGHDALIVFHEPEKEKPLEHIEAANAFIEGAKQAGVPHIVMMGHAFGKWTGNTRDAYDAYRPIVQAQREALKLFMNESGLNWSYVRGSFPERHDEIEGYYMSSDINIINHYGEHRVLPKNFISALLDETEKGILELHEEEEREL